MDNKLPTTDSFIKVFENFFKVEFTQCESSNILAYAKIADGLHVDILILYKAKARALTCYRYLGAGKLYGDLEKAESKGKWVNANLVKGDFNIKKYEYKL